ncbi:SAM-dependent methyltransferase [Dactylosporangium sp. McL0621]|uniref:SAM-dependent methyltransferase n=1 Tax=Dactylosporangium sp. McL0621 TaxID=3415678 RepID=UPI003CF06D54
MRHDQSATPLPKIDTTVPHPARRYDYWLGGKDNFAADRESGDAVAAAFPTIRTAIIENRAFLRRAVTFLTAQAGIRQFFDIGTGIPTSPNVHEIAQSIAPTARVVYVDNDPVVLSHARALMTSAPEGATAYIDADLRDPNKILNDADLRRVLDMSAPVALMLVAILHFIPAEADPYGIVARLVDALPSGSYLVMSHATYDFMPPEAIAKLDAADSGQIKFNPRSRDDFARFFDGLELLPPGIVSIAEWRAEDEPAPRPTAAEMASHCAVARKP